MKKFDWKLTLSVVSLLLAIVLLVTLGKHKVGVFFAFIFLAVAWTLLLNYKSKELDKALETLSVEMGDNVENQYYDIASALKLEGQLRKQKRKNNLLYTGSAIIVIVAFLMLI